jgi:pilus assembly protein FimV
VPASAAPTAADAAAPGVDLESQQVFADGADAAGAGASPADAAAPGSTDAATTDQTAASAAAESAQANAEEAAAPAAPAAAAAETSTPPAASASTPTPARASAAAAAAAKPAPAQSLLSQVLGWIANPLLLIGLGIGAVLLTAVWYLRHRREDDDQDVTGRWDALEAEIEEEVQAQTVRTKRLPDEQRMTVEEHGRRPRVAAADEEEVAPLGRAADAADDDTLSSQTVINLDQADPVDEADFHMAYGLYDQAADLVSRALEAEPGRRDLKLKLLEVYFVWGNKDAFLTEARKLHADLGGASGGDWDKVLIMGKQICPDEPIFSESAAAAGALDMDLEGDRATELDFAFDEKDAGSDGGAGFDFDLELAPTGERFAPEVGESDESFDFGELEPDELLLGEEDEPRERNDRRGREQPLDAPLDIGAQTAAGLEAALFMGDDEDEDAPAEAGGATTLTAEIDGSAVTQESPTVESERSEEEDWASLFGELNASEEDDAVGPDSPTMETPTVEAIRADAPTVETVRADAPTVETRTIHRPVSADAPTVETPTLETSFAGRTTRISTLDASAAGDASAELGASSEHTEEIDLDDLGLSLGDLEDLPDDIGELPHADDGESDTREQPVLRGDDELLSATGVTEVLHEDDLEQMETSVLQGDSVLIAVGGDDDYRGTEIIEQRREADGSGDTSLVRSLSGYAEEGELDLNLEELSAALEGGDTVEQPRGSSFHGDFFGGGSTPIDLDIGSDLVGPDDPTGTEHMGPLDPQTMTEIGTKLDLARAYIDMGDPEGARSILEEVLDEGDAGQRREAQGLIEALSA